MKHPPPPGLAHLSGALEELRSQDRLRVRFPAPVAAKSFCSNDYLGLANWVDPSATASPGAGGSRLIAGDHSAHENLERALATWLGVDSSLVFSSGYAANVAVISALAGPNDTIISDERNHASLVDGCRLSRASVVVTPHLSVEAVESALAKPHRGRTWVVTESYFSMDADTPDLAALRQLCDRFGAALVVDEAHALGVFGPDGRGLSAASGVVPDVLIGTFGKAFGRAGAFVAGSNDLTLWLWNRARPFVFSTGVSPLLAASVLSAFAQAKANPTLRGRVLAASARFREGLVSRETRPLGYGHIVPILVGDSRRAVQAAKDLQGNGVLVQAIRPPTVASGTDRLRISITATLSDEDLDRATNQLMRVLA